VSTLVVSVGLLGLGPGSGSYLLSLAVIVLGASGTFVLLPHSHGAFKRLRVVAVGGGVVALCILLLACFWTPPGPFLTSLFFYGFGLASVAGGVLMITSRNPIYSALWFAAVVLATSGLFLLAGAQFLAAGTVIVYAGAIIVTFLFVIMLAQSSGQAVYDRMARSPGRATFSCFLLLWALLYALLGVQTPPQTRGRVTADRRLVRSSEVLSRYGLVANSRVAQVLNRANRPTTLMQPAGPAGGQPASDVAGLGGALYTDHLIAAEVAGVLLFVALIGALSIATPRAPIRPGARPPAD
jgi:NADH-quinone oxidoreductase subunit J